MNYTVIKLFKIKTTLILSKDNTVLENEKSATSNTDGKFILKPLPYNIYTIKIEKEGYETTTIPDVHVKLGKIKTLRVVLSQIS